MSDRCGRTDCPGPARCGVRGCEALHPNACGAELSKWLCPRHEWLEPLAQQIADRLLEEYRSKHRNDGRN